LDVDIDPTLLGFSDDFMLDTVACRIGGGGTVGLLLGVLSSEMLENSENGSVRLTLTTLGGGIYRFASSCRIGTGGSGIHGPAPPMSSGISLLELSSYS
jgi:hypothetical protein